MHIALHSFGPASANVLCRPLLRVEQKSMYRQRRRSRPGTGHSGERDMEDVRHVEPDEVYDTHDYGEELGRQRLKTRRRRGSEKKGDRHTFAQSHPITKIERQDRDAVSWESAQSHGCKRKTGLASSCSAKDA